MARPRSLNVTIRAKGKGFEARPSVNGKQVTVYRSTIKEVEAELAKMFLQKGRQESGTTTLGEFIATWNEREKTRADSGSRSPATYRIRKVVLETHVVPSLGHIRLSALDRDMLREWAEAGEKRLRTQPKPEKRRGRGTGTRSFQAAYAALSACLSEAVDNGLITVNPCLKQGRRSVKPHHQKAPIEVLAWEQIEKLLATAQGDDYEPYLYHLLLLAVTSGMRQGELLALRWEDVTLNEATVFVHRNVTQGTEGGLVEKGTKTATGERRIVLPSATVASLRRWQSLVPSEAGSLVFPNSDQSWIKKDNLMHRGFRPLLRDAGLADVTFHSLRHSHASLLISKGVNIKTISERLGHKSIQVTLDTYGHLMPGDQERCAAVYDTLISGKALRAVS